MGVDSPEIIADGEGMTTQLRDYRPEVHGLVSHLIVNGFTVVAASDGEDTHTASLTPDRIAEIVTSVDEARILVAHPSLKRPDGTLRRLSILLVLGNAPGELVCDYSDVHMLDEVLTDFACEWEDREQPMSDAADTWTDADETDHRAAEQEIREEDLDPEIG